MPEDTLTPKWIAAQVVDNLDCTPDELRTGLVLQVTRYGQQLLDAQKQLLMEILRGCYEDELAHLRLRMIRDAQAPRFKALEESHPEIYRDFIEAREGPHETLLANRRTRVTLLTALIEGRHRYGKPVITAEMARHMDDPVPPWDPQSEPTDTEDRLKSLEELIAAHQMWMDSSAAVIFEAGKSMSETKEDILELRKQIRSLSVDSPVSS